MKVVFDTTKGTLTVGKKTYGVDLPIKKQDEIISSLERFLEKNTKLSDYEEDSMWMSYRYCIGRHTIAAHMHAGGIATHCYGRMSNDRSIFTAFDINREIEGSMRFGIMGAEWYFPITSLNKIYTSAIDIFCQFVNDYGIETIEDLLKYNRIDVILADNERGYKLETTTWEEVIRPQVYEYFKKVFSDKEITEDKAWELFQDFREGKNIGELHDTFLNDLILKMPNKKYFSLMSVEDLFVWNDLVHLFDLEHHHKSVLVDGTEVEWYWTYTTDTEQREDGLYYKKELGYKKIRVPVNAKIGTVTRWIPDSSIIKDLY